MEVSKRFTQIRSVLNYSTVIVEIKSMENVYFLLLPLMTQVQNEIFSLRSNKQILIEATNLWQLHTNLIRRCRLSPNFYQCCLSLRFDPVEYHLFFLAVF